MVAAAAALALALAALPLAASAETVLGVYIFHRHGDRTAKSTPPTYLTALGAEQVHASGAYYRGRYVAANATSRIQALSPDVAVLSQLAVTAPVDSVLQNSASVFAQGLYPPAGDAARQTLADGTVAEAPLGGYQYVPVNGVATAASSASSEDSEWLQGGSGCGNAVVSSNAYFASRQYLDTLAGTADFYRRLLPVVNRTFSESQLSFKNGYTIFDLINVARIHNSTIQSADLVTDDVFHQLATRADQHEWGLAFNASEPVRAIAGSVLAAQVLQTLNATLQAPATRAATTRMGIQFGAYGTFMAFFGLAQLPAVSDDFTGVCGYASSMVFELVTNATTADTSAVDPADVSVRFLFSNGSASAGHEPVAYPLFGRRETLLPWKTFADEMSKFAVGDTLDWCKACGNTTGVCAAAAAAGGSGSGAGSASASSSDGGGMSRPVAGVIGALVTLAVILGIEALVMLVGGLRLVKKSVAARGKAAEAGHA